MMKRWYLLGLVVLGLLFLRYGLPPLLLRQALAPSQLPTGWVASSSTPVPLAISALFNDYPPSGELKQQAFIDHNKQSGQLALLYFGNTRTLSVPYLYTKLTDAPGHAVNPEIHLGHVAHSREDDQANWQIVWHRCNFIALLQVAKAIPEQDVLAYAKRIDGYLGWIGAC